MSKIIQFTDVTLRDGEQTPGVSFSVREKTTIAALLEKLGVNCIEAGFASSSAGDMEAIDRISRQAKPNTTVCSLARCMIEDIDAAAKALQHACKPKIHMIIGCSDIHLKYKFGFTPEQMLSRIKSMIGYAADTGMQIQFSAEDATRTDRDFLRTVYLTALDAGADIINITDTVGYCLPNEYETLVRDVRGWVGDDVLLSVHCHNDLGLATANSLAGIRGGADIVECTLNAMGERAGNASLEEVAVAMRVRADLMDYKDTIKAKQIFPICKAVATYSGLSVGHNKPIVGDNCFTHQSGIHQNSVLKNPSTYELFSPSLIGRISGGELMLSKLSGRHGFEERLKELGFELTRDELDDAFARFMKLAEFRKTVSDREITAIAQIYTSRVNHIYLLKNYQSISGSNAISTATVNIVTPSGEVLKAAAGGGPVDAIFHAIEEATGISFKITSLDVKAVDEGKDSLCEVRLIMEKDGRRFIGRGINTDMIAAAAFAYMNALNRAVLVLDSFKEISDEEE